MIRCLLFLFFAMSFGPNFLINGGDLADPETACDSTIAGIDCCMLPYGDYKPKDVACPDFFVRCEKNKQATSVPCTGLDRFSNTARECVDFTEIPECFCEFRPDGPYVDLYVRTSLEPVDPGFPQVCRAFIRCENSQAHFEQCSFGEVFNERNGECMLHSQAPQPCGAVILPPCAQDEICRFRGLVESPEECDGCEDGLVCRMRGSLADIYFCLSRTCAQDEDCAFDCECEDDKNCQSGTGLEGMRCS